MALDLDGLDKCGLNYCLLVVLPRWHCVLHPLNFGRGNNSIVIFGTPHPTQLGRQGWKLLRLLELSVFRSIFLGFQDAFDLLGALGVLH